MPEPRIYLTVSLTMSGYAILHLPTFSVVCDNLDRACERILEDAPEFPVFLTVDEVFGEPWHMLCDGGEWYDLESVRA